MLPKLLVFENDFLQVLKSNDHWVNFAEFTKFEKFDS